MFKQKQKQESKPITKPNNKLLNSIERYHRAIKSRHFEMSINQGVGDSERMDMNYRYQSRVWIGDFEEMMDSVVKNFSSLYQMDQKRYEWREKVEMMVKAGKEMVKIIDRVKSQMQRVSQIVERNEELQRVNEILIKENGQMKREIESIRISEQQRVKWNDAQQKSLKITVNQEKLQIDIAKVHQEQQRVLLLEEENSKLKAQLHRLRQRLETSEEQNKDLRMYLKRIYDSSFDYQTILQTRIKVKDQIVDLDQDNHQNRPIEKKESIVSFENDVLLNQKLSALIVAFLPPKSITRLFSLSKHTRFFLMHSPQVILATFRSINGYKNFQIAYFHRHIEHFEKLTKKIPEEVVQLAFYQYNILKEQIGGDFMAVLNLCGNIFEGKMAQGSGQGNRVLKEYLDGKEIMHHVIAPKEDEVYIQVEAQLVRQFFDERKGRKQSIMKEIELMGGKIALSESIYSVDESSLRQFYQTIMRYFTILFVLSKQLFSEARDLQYLNNFLLSELSQITRFKIQKEYDLEDVQTELESSNRMNQFLSDKCTKSEQRILRQTMQLLEAQKAIAKLNQLLKNQQSKKSLLQSECQLKVQEVEKVVIKYNELKALYNSTKDKYNRLLSQLGVVKQTILKIK